MMIAGFALVGFAYGPIGTVLAELFPTAVRYTGSSLTYNFAGHRRRLDRPVRRHVAGHQLGPRLRGLLPVGVGAALAVRAVRVAGNPRHVALAAPTPGRPAPAVPGTALAAPGGMGCPATAPRSQNTVAGDTGKVRGGRGGDTFAAGRRDLRRSSRLADPASGPGRGHPGPRARRPAYSSGRARRRRSRRAVGRTWRWPGSVLRRRRPGARSGSTRAVLGDRDQARRVQRRVHRARSRRARVERQALPGGAHRGRRLANPVGGRLSPAARLHARAVDRRRRRRPQPAAGRALSRRAARPARAEKPRTRGPTTTTRSSGPGRWPGCWCCR